MDDLLDQNDVARILKVSVFTVRSWRAKGTGPPWSKFGEAKNSAVRYSERGLEEWIESKKKGNL